MSGPLDQEVTDGATRSRLAAPSTPVNAGTGERGQTVTEFLMISGLITSMAIILLSIMQVPLRANLQRIAEFAVGQLLDPPW